MRSIPALHPTGGGRTVLVGERSRSRRRQLSWAFGHRRASTMAGPPRTPLSIPRGLCGALDGAVWVALAFALSFGLVFHRGAELRSVVLVALWGAAVGACAGWAAAAPGGRYTLSGSFAVVFLWALPLWAILLALDLTPHRYKGGEHPAVYPSEALVMVGPPVVVAAVVTLVRVRRVGRTAETEPGAAADRAGTS